MNKLLNCHSNYPEGHGQKSLFHILISLKIIMFFFQIANFQPFVLKILEHGYHIFVYMLSQKKVCLMQNLFTTHRILVALLCMSGPSSI